MAAEHTGRSASRPALPSAQMADQLSLDLRVALPRLPAAIRPMLAQPAADPFDSPEHLFEPSWGGVRILAFVEAAGDDMAPSVRLLDERGRNVTTLLPELASLPSRVAAESAVLDGEIVVVDRLGRSDPLALAARLRGNPGPSVAFLAFDLLIRDGRPLFGVALERRREQLRRLLLPSEEAIAVPSIAGEGRALYAAVVEAGIAGVMGRMRRSPYLPGVRSRLWRFVARRDPDPFAPEGTAPAESSPDDTAASEAVPGNAPMLALIRRLPLDDPEP